jgi:hypothetical protein
MKGRTGKADQERQKRTGRKDRQKRTGRKDRQNRTGGRELALTGQIG